MSSVTPADSGGSRDLADATAHSAASKPCLVMVTSPEGAEATWAAEVTAAGARVLLVTDSAALASVLEEPAVDAVVICADDPDRCATLLAAARRQISRAERTVPLIVWRARAGGPAGSRSFVYQLGADSVLDAPSPVSDLLSCTFALRRLIRRAHSEG
jgi:hypothetical protein